MTLDELFRSLSLVELSNHVMGDKGSGSIRAADKPAATLLANDGMLDLYSRFIVRERTLIIRQTSTITSYRVSAAHAESQIGVTAGPHFIVDTPDEPFEDDFIRVLEAYNESGWQYLLNQDGNEKAMFTPEQDLIQLPDPEDGVLIGVEYQAKPKKFSESLPQTDVYLPAVLEKALRYYVAAHAYAKLQSDSGKAASYDYLTKYEAEVAKCSALGLVTQNQSQVLSKFEARGFV